MMVTLFLILMTANGPSYYPVSAHATMDECVAAAYRLYTSHPTMCSYGLPH